MQNEKMTEQERLAAIEERLVRYVMTLASGPVYKVD